MGSSDAAVMILTRNRSRSLARMLSQNASWLSSFTPILIDDSTDSDSAALNQRICRNHTVRYHGLTSQRAFLRNQRQDELQELVLKLGSPGWTLPQARNYAALVALASHTGYTLMMDDDLLLSPPEAERLAARGEAELKDLLTGVPAIGCNVVELVDDSVVGHACRKAGMATEYPLLLVPRFPSGGLLAARTRPFEFPFPPLYNEDWIWLYFENGGRPPCKSFTVLQQSARVLERAEAIAYSQELGEIAWIGLSGSSGDTARLQDPAFWDTVIGPRQAMLRSFRRRLQTKEVPTQVRKALRGALQAHRSIKGMTLASIFQKYFRSRERWQMLQVRATA